MTQTADKGGARRRDPEDGHGESDRLRIATLNRACVFLEENLDREVSLEELGAEVGWSPAHLQRVFRGRIGVSPKEYVRALRVSRMKEELREGDRGRGGRSANGGGSTARAILDSGFGSLSSGHEAGLRHLGMTPATYGAGGRGAVIEFCPARCSLGWVMLGRTDRGICSLTLGDDPEALLAELGAEFPEAELVPGDSATEELCAQVVALAESGEDGRHLPVEVVATDFQWKVWRAMREIPLGETRSYSDLAAMVGRPTAVRAAASACARNRISLLIPCHRVVRADGSLGEYRWGSERKQRLQDNECETRSRGT